MKSKKSNQKKWERLDTISFRGERKVWLRFLSLIKKKGLKNAWAVLGILIQEYLKQEQR